MHADKIATWIDKRAGTHYHLSAVDHHLKASIWGEGFRGLPVMYRFGEQATAMKPRTTVQGMQTKTSSRPRMLPAFSLTVRRGVCFSRRQRLSSSGSFATVRVPCAVIREFIC